MADKNRNMIIIIGVIVLAVLLINQSQLFAIAGTTYEHEINYTFEGINVLAGSTFEFGHTDIDLFLSSCNANTHFLDIDNDVSEFAISITSQGSSDGDSCGFGPHYIPFTTSLITDGFDIDSTKLDTLKINFDQFNRISCHAEVSVSLNPSIIYLINKGTGELIEIYRSEGASHTRTSNEKSGQITIFDSFGSFVINTLGESDEFTLPDGIYEFVLLAPLTPESSATPCGDGGGVSQEISIDNIVITYFEEPETFYRFENNACNSISLLVEEITDNDYSTLGECELNIIDDTDSNETVDGNETGNQTGNGGGGNGGDDCHEIFVFSDNTCTFDCGLEPNDMTTFNTLEECMEKIKGKTSVFDKLLGPTFILIVVITGAIFFLSRRKK